MNRIKTFFIRQCKEIISGDTSKVFNKFVKLFYYPPLILIALPIVIVIRIIAPIKLIRFGFIRSDVIGASIVTTEYYLSYLDIHNLKPLDFFYFDSPAPNKQWKIMTKRILRVNFFYKFIDYCNKSIPGGKKHEVIMSKYSKGYQRDLTGIYKKTNPHYYFTEKENKIGEKFLKKIGVTNNKKIICFIVRDSAYKKKFQPHLNDKEFSYRNSNIDNYNLAALTLAKKGYWVIRMGKSVEQPFRANHSRIFDYANSEYRSDFLDIWLNANCFFGLSNSCGLDEVIKTFRKPLIHVDCIPLGDIISGKDDLIVLPKYLRSKKNGSKLSIRDQINIGVMRFTQTKELHEMSLDYIDNEPEEIKDACLELEARLNGNWTESKENIYNQKKFWNIISEWKDFKKWHGGINPIISESFLLKNANWFLK